MMTKYGLSYQSRSAWEQTPLNLKKYLIFRLCTQSPWQKIKQDIWKTREQSSCSDWQRAWLYRCFHEGRSLLGSYHFLPGGEPSVCDGQSPFFSGPSKNYCPPPLWPIEKKTGPPLAPPHKQTPPPAKNDSSLEALCNCNMYLGELSFISGRGGCLFVGGTRIFLGGQRGVPKFF